MVAGSDFLRCGKGCIGRGAQPVLMVVPSLTSAKSTPSFGCKGTRSEFSVCVLELNEKVEQKDSDENIKNEFGLAKE